VRDAIVIALAVIGLAFTLSGAVGILRMPDVYSRIQCSSKTVTMGTLPMLIALVVGKGLISSYGSRALLVAALLLILNPAASHALARAAYKSGVPMWPGAVTDEPRAQARARSAQDGGDNGGDSGDAGDGGDGGDGGDSGDAGNSGDAGDGGDGGPPEDEPARNKPAGGQAAP
jgi:multicomponent Na+:H+ antiporter subunit G